MMAKTRDSTDPGDVSPETFWERGWMIRVALATRKKGLY